MLHFTLSSTIKPGRQRNFMRVVLAVFLLLFCSLAVFPAAKTWSGAGADANWATAANWTPAGAPAANDDLIFPAAALQQSNNNNTTIFTTYRSITIEGGTYTIGGNLLRLTNGLTVTTGTQTLNVPITLSGAQTFLAGTGGTATIVILSIGSSALTIDGAGVVGIGLISGSGQVIKNGTGAGAIIAATGFSGPLRLNNGIFVVDANIPSSVVTIDNPTATTGALAISGFGGTGTVGAVTVTQGALSAGTLTSPTGILNLASGVNFTANGIYACKIGGAVAGAGGYDQLNVTGTVSLTNARLAPIPWSGFRPAVGDTYLILKNDGTDAINGTFLNLPEGKTFSGPLGTAFQITYVGGDGNDISIKRVARSLFDFDGDGKADQTVFRPGNGAWYEYLSANNGFYAVGFGTASDKIAPADFDGDNKADVTVYRPSSGVWFSLRSSDSTLSVNQFGTDGDIPVPNDFDGDGLADLAVFRPSTGVWYQLKSLGSQFAAVQFGQNGDRPLMGDYDGDGIGDLAVYRGGAWYFLRSADNSFLGVSFGFPTDIPTPADFDGDGKTDIAVYRDGTWFELLSSNNSIQGFGFGVAGDIPVAGDYDGDGKDDAAVYRNGVWYMLRTTAGFGAVSFGLGGDQPAPAAFR